jgi:hypothetical protein
MRRVQIGNLVKYLFRLEGEPSDEAHTTVTFNGADEFIVTSNITGIICVLRSEPAKATPEKVRKSSSEER